MESMILSVVIFSFTMAITPGPNNMMLTASGANFGFRKTIPHIAGIIMGMTVLYILSALGIGGLFYSFPQIQIFLKVAGSAYLIYFALRLMFSKRSENRKSVSKPLNILQALGFQFLNPKALMITITAVSAYSSKGKLYITSILIMITSFIIIGTICISMWAGFGAAIGSFLKNDRVFRLFNISLGILTASTVIIIIR